MIHSPQKNHVAQAQGISKVLNKFASLNMGKKQQTCSIRILNMDFPC